MSVTDRARGTPYTRPARNSKVSPFLGTAKAPLILLIAMLSEPGFSDDGVAPPQNQMGSEVGMQETAGN